MAKPKMKVVYVALKPLPKGGGNVHNLGDMIPEAAGFKWIDAMLRAGEVFPVFVATLPKEQQEALAEWEQEKEDEIKANRKAAGLDEDGNRIPASELGVGDQVPLKEDQTDDAKDGADEPTADDDKKDESVPNEEREQGTGNIAENVLEAGVGGQAPASEDQTTEAKDGSDDSDEEEPDFVGMSKKELTTYITDANTSVKPGSQDNHDALVVHANNAHRLSRKNYAGVNNEIIHAELDHRGVKYTTADRKDDLVLLLQTNDGTPSP